MPLDEFLDDIFHSCALRAYVDVATEMQTSKPHSSIVKRRAYQYYEEHKREINQQKVGAA